LQLVSAQRTNIKFSIYEKVRCIRDGYLPAIDLCFCGYRAWHWRGDICEQMNKADWGELHTRLHGQNMRDGLLAHGPGGACGADVAKLYATSLMGVNPQVSSIYNGRLIDLWTCGAVQLIHDPHKELAEEGFREGEHYIGFDGTITDLIHKAQRIKKDPPLCAELIERAFERMTKYQKRTSETVYAEIYRDHMTQLEVGRNG
jgi:hypothetical protein